VEQPRIESAKPGHHAQIDSLEDRSLHYSPIDRARCAYVREQTPAIVLVATIEGDRVCGYITVSRVRNGRSQNLWIVAQAVDPGLQRLGIGRLLVRAVLKRAKAVGISRVRLKLACDNQAAIALYTSCGFRQQLRVPDAFGPGLSGFVMVRAVN
jgi:ribosomal protein S18 acetylase RimI-like enzyme